MKSGTRVALAVGAGYLLGRRRKVRMALMLGGAAMTGGGIPGQLARRGTKLLGSSDVLGKLTPELGEVTGLIGEELVPVGKAAARAAVNSQINALSDRVHERAEALRNPPEEPAEEEEEVLPSGRGRRGQRFGDEDEYETGDEAEEAPEPRMARAGRRPAETAPRAAGPGLRRARAEDEAHGRRRARAEDEPHGVRRARAEDEEEDEGMPVRAAGSHAGAPVRRVRR